MANNSCLSDVNALFESAEFKQFQERKDKQFKALLETIARSR